MPEAAPQPTEAAPVPLQRRDLWLAVLLAGVLGVMSFSRVYFGACGQCHDDGLYVVTAKALAEGEGYRLINLPGDPPQTKYPPLYPAVLALLWKLWPAFPDNLLLLQGFNILCWSAFVGLAYLYIVRFGHATRGVAFSAVLLCCVYSTFVFFSVVTMSEPLFALLLVALLWWLEGALRSPAARPSRDFLGGVLLALPFLCRSIGLLFIPLGLALLWRNGRRWRWAAVGAVLATLPWLLWSLAAANEARRDPVQGYYTDYVGWWTSFGPPALAQVVTRNFTWLLTSIPAPLLEALTWPLRMGSSSRLWFALTAPFGLLTLGVLARDLWRGRVLPKFLAAYLILVCVWPWMPVRFLIPLLPFLMVYLLRGCLLPIALASERHHPAADAAGSPPVRRGKTHLAALARLCFAVALGMTLGEHVRMSLVRHRYDTPNPEQGEKRHAWATTQRLLDWLSTHSGPRDVIAAGIDPTVTLYTGRKSYYPIICPPLSIHYGFEYPREDVYRLALGSFERYRPRFLVLTANFHGEEEYRDWVRLLKERLPDLLVPVYRDEADPRFEVYEIRYPATFPS